MIWKIISPIATSHFKQATEHSENSTAKSNLKQFSWLYQETLKAKSKRIYKYLYYSQCKNAGHIESTTLPCEAILEYEFNYSYSKGIPERTW
ncbi:hypothetical protein C0J52_17431 [Blattella germanica]|nr:hypothetical protein C0J52_17431 [Blattella germanica]